MTSCSVLYSQQPVDFAEGLAELERQSRAAAQDLARTGAVSARALRLVAGPIVFLRRPRRHAFEVAN